MAADPGGGRAPPPGPPGHAPAAAGRARRHARSRSWSPASSGSASIASGPGMQFVEQRAWIPGAGDRLPPRGGRHQPAPRAPDDPPHAALPPVRVDADHDAREGVPGRDVPPRDGDARRLRGARPLPVLRLLGGDAGPDVPDHRGLGRAPPRLRGGEVHPLHDGRVRAHAPGHPDALLPAGRPRRVVRLRRRDAAPHRPAAPGAALPGLRARLRDQGAHGALPHLAPGRARRGAHGGQRDPGGRAPEDGHLRVPPLRPAALPRRGRAPGARDRRAGAGRASSTARGCRPSRPT